METLIERAFTCTILKQKEKTSLLCEKIEFELNIYYIYIIYLIKTEYIFLENDDLGQMA